MTSTPEELIGELRELRDGIFHWMTRNVHTPEGAVKVLGQVKESLTEIIASMPSPTPNAEQQAVERVARALYDAGMGKWQREWPHEDFVTCAKAVIAAYREVECK